MGGNRGHRARRTARDSNRRLRRARQVMYERGQRVAVIPLPADDADTPHGLPGPGETCPVMCLCTACRRLDCGNCGRVAS